MAQRLDKTVLLPEAHFILEAALDRGRRRKFAHGLRNTSGKVFLNATIACASSSPYMVSLRPFNPVRRRYSVGRRAAVRRRGIDPDAWLDPLDTGGLEPDN